MRNITLFVWLSVLGAIVAGLGLAAAEEDSRQIEASDAPELSFIEILIGRVCVCYEKDRTSPA
ncbi:MAG: hypothetical protein PHI64_13580 [Zoogloea sp.]|uniref:hypothetical protein n=1 Tax=Zoogloea sp. TaxID=49181 RepID=UPI00260376CC|nr:hypothetical protein [Zoogloea sp.]MDD2989982.1 hypothetical protein [Zoogloea sp.]